MHIKIFVASTKSEWLPLKVLEFSIQELCSNSVEVYSINNFARVIPTPKKINNRPKTPFSFQRFLIPELCGYSGKAIYLDADMQVFRDISELWNHDFSGCDLQTVQVAKKGRRGQFSVMLLDCKALGWNVEQIVADLDTGKLNYAALMYEMRVAKKIGRDISSSWNSLEFYEPGKTSLLHYTDMNTQPWISIYNPLGYLWISCLRRAMLKGFIKRSELLREIELGHVRPSLISQIDLGVDDVSNLKKSQIDLDKNFVAPYKMLGPKQLYSFNQLIHSLKNIFY
jgi:hypothetical protein